MAQALAVRPVRLLAGPLTATLDFYLPRPKSAPKRVTLPIRKPDTSNLLKAAEDAMRGVVYADDSLIVDLHVRKRFADAENPPGVHVLIEELAV